MGSVTGQSRVCSCSTTITFRKIISSHAGECLKLSLCVCILRMQGFHLRADDKLYKNAVCSHSQPLACLLAFPTPLQHSSPLAHVFSDVTHRLPIPMVHWQHTRALADIRFGEKGRRKEETVQFVTGNKWEFKHLHCSQPLEIEAEKKRPFSVCPPLGYRRLAFNR